MSDQSFFPEWRNFLGSSSDSETTGFLKSVVKRSGEIATYDRTKIEKAIEKAIMMSEVGDKVVISGKGTEPYYEIMGKKEFYREDIVISSIIKNLEKN